MTIRRALLTVALVTVAIAAAVPSADAGVVLSPVSATASSTFDASTDISNTYTQVGLLPPFVSGVTDWATYFAGVPLKNFLFTNEWFSESGVARALVTYDLGAVYSLATLALWNEDTNGIGNTNILASIDGVNYAPVVLDFVPVQGPINVDYTAQFLSLGGASARYIQFEITECPNPAALGAFNGCAIGEVAFESVAGVVPEPMSGALLVAGLVALGVARRRRA